jgi:hypothetical protein
MVGRGIGATNTRSGKWLVGENVTKLTNLGVGHLGVGHLGKIQFTTHRGIGRSGKMSVGQI